MGFELNAYYVQDKTGTLYELVEVFPKLQRIAVQNCATLTTTQHNEAWAATNLRLLRCAVSDELADDEVPKAWAA